MNDFLVTTEDIITNIISVENSFFLLQSLDNGQLEVSVNDNESTLIIESSFIENINNLEIQKYNDYNLTLSNTIYGQLPESIPVDIISGNWPIDRIDGLDEYLSTIPLDGGSP